MKKTLFVSPPQPLTTRVGASGIRMDTMKAACFDVYQRIPINSGGDWYAYQLFSDIAQHARTAVYFTLRDNLKQGYCPRTVNFTQSHIKPLVPWGTLSMILEQMRPDVLLNKSSVNQIEADVVFTLVYTFNIARYVARKNRCPLVMVMQNIEWQYLKHNHSPFYPLMRLYERHAVRVADAVVTLSPHDYSYVAERTAHKKVFYVPPKLDETTFSASATPRYDFGNDKLNVLFYGSLDRRYNVDALEFVKYELIPRLKERGLLRDIRINVFGSGEPPAKFDLNHDRDINFLGFVDDPGSYVRGADVVIAPITNPSGMKVRVIEALACGKPVVGTPEAVVGLPYELRDAVTVRRTAEEFIEAILSLNGRSIPATPEGRTIEACSSLKINTMKEVFDFI